MKGRSCYTHRPVWPRGPEEGPEMSWYECNDPDGLTLEEEDSEPLEDQDSEEEETEGKEE